MPCRTAFLAVAGAVALAVTAAADATPRRPTRSRASEWAVAPAAVFDLPGAWQLSQGAGVVVAVVDSGMKMDHPDLAPNAWTNFAEVPDNGVDDDNNGYVDDVHGVDLTTTKTGQDLHDGLEHGTHVAGTIAAAANSRGVVGVAYRAKLMTVKVLGDDGGGTTGGVAEGIRYAAANGARIINLSLEGDTDDPRMRAAVDAAAAANALIICSAGNSGIDVDQKPVYPVSIPAPNVVGVAATEPDEGRDLPDFSNYGKLTVPVAAPGVEVISTSKSGGYEYKSGTSMAAPHVVGVAALMAAVAPDLPRPSCARCCSSMPSAPRCRSARATSTRSARSSPRARVSSTRPQPRPGHPGAERDPQRRHDPGPGWPWSARRRPSAAWSSSSTAARSPRSAAAARCSTSVCAAARASGSPSRPSPPTAAAWPARRAASAPSARASASVGSGGGVGGSVWRADPHTRLPQTCAPPARAGGGCDPPPPHTRAGDRRGAHDHDERREPAQAVVADLAYFYRREHPGAPRFSIVGGGTGHGDRRTRRAESSTPGCPGARSPPGTRRAWSSLPLALSARSAS